MDLKGRKFILFFRWVCVGSVGRGRGGRYIAILIEGSRVVLDFRGYRIMGKY